MTYVCITYLVHCGFQNYQPLNASAWEEQRNFESLCKHDDLLGYAYSSWIYHNHQCGCYSPALEAVTDLVLTSTTFPLKGQPFLDFGGPLHVAVAYGLQDLILPAARLQSPNAVTLLYGRSPLHLAVDAGHLACAQTLLSLPGISVNVRNSWGFTPLMLAASSGKLLFVHLLVKASGIEINAAHEDGGTALTWAVRSGQTEAVKLLLGLSGINVNAKDVNGSTPLIHATYGGHTEVVQQLLHARDLDVNIAATAATFDGIHKFDVGSTALMIASHRGHVDIVKHLLEAPGIDLNVVSAGPRQGHTALSYAFAYGRTEIVDLLLASLGSTSQIG
jgi:ankyrin repeat protein